VLGRLEEFLPLVEEPDRPSLLRELLAMELEFRFRRGEEPSLDEYRLRLPGFDTRKIRDFPLVLMGRDFWEPLLGFLRQRLVREATIDPTDAERILVTDSPEEAVQAVTQVALQRFGLTYGPRVRRRWFLWE
jgi:hypothetical protein